jgi:hypothetical protein
MRTGLLIVMAVALLIGQLAAISDDSFREWRFDDVAVDRLPSDFVLGTYFDNREAGEWKVVNTPKALSPPNVLAQLRNKGAEHNYNLVLLNNTNGADVDVSVSFLPISGKADMGGGLAWRAGDDRNYYLTRANPLEQNIRLYYVVKGVRKILKNYDQIIDMKWHRLRVLHQGCQIKVFYDDREIFDVCDQTLGAGRVGLWTKSDAVTYFDNLQLRILK